MPDLGQLINYYIEKESNTFLALMYSTCNYIYS